MNIKNFAKYFGAITILTALILVVSANTYFAGAGSTAGSQNYYSITVVVPKDVVVDNLVIHKLFGPRNNQFKDTITLNNEKYAVSSPVQSPVFYDDKHGMKGAPVFKKDAKTVTGYKTYRLRLPANRTYLLSYICKVGNNDVGVNQREGGWVARDRGIYLDSNKIIYVSVDSLTVRYLVLGAEKVIETTGHKSVDANGNVVSQTQTQ